MLKKAILLFMVLAMLLTGVTLLAACKEKEPPVPPNADETPNGDQGKENQGAVDEVFDWDFLTNDRKQVRSNLTDAQIEALLAQNTPRWEMSENGVLTLKGICAVAPTFDSAADQPWVKFNQLHQADSGVWRPAVKKVVVEPTFMQLPAYAFQDCTDLVSVTLPINMGALPEACFLGCTSLTTVTGCAGLTEIGEWAFSGCPKLERIEVSVSLASVGYAAFDKSCSGIGSSALCLQIRGTSEAWEANKANLSVDAVGNAAFQKAVPLFVS